MQLSLVLQPFRHVHNTVWALILPSHDLICAKCSLPASITRFNYSSLYINFSRIKTRSLISHLIKKSAQV